MRLVQLASFALVAVLAAACSSSSATGPQSPPVITLVNGAPKPTGLVGMTVVIQGTDFGTAVHGQVFFTPAGGAAIPATIVDPSTDWTNTVIVTTVPRGITTTAEVTVQTAAGTSNKVLFTAISNQPFSPSTITWTLATALPNKLQGLGAAFVPVTTGTPAEYVFAVGGADTTNTATAGVYRAQIQAAGALGAWSTALPPLPQPRAYQTTVAATAYTSAIDTTAASGYLYSIGGVDNAGHVVATVYVARVGLDGSLGAWQTTTALPSPRHSSGATVFDGYIYLVGGAGAGNTPNDSAYRALIHADGTLGAWETIASLPQQTAYLAVSNFGPYMYAVGGDNGTVAPGTDSSSGSETGNVYMAQIDPRNGMLAAAGWSSVTAMGKARSKHSALAAGGALLASSGVYGGSAGSSENRYGTINADGTLGSWNGATGTNTIDAVLGYSVYNEASVAFTDALGHGHLMLLGGGDRATGNAVAGVVYY